MRDTGGHLSVALSICLVWLGCASCRETATERSARAWSGEVQVYGALRAMFHEDQTGATVSLDSILPSADLYAVGALADLAGEVTIAAGEAYLSYPDGAHNTRTDVGSQTGAAATLLVTAKVPEWRSFVIENQISFESLDDEIAQLAEAAGMQLTQRIPFLLEGEIEDLHWHVIDGGRLSGGGSSHEDHLAAGVKEHKDLASATLVGFYSQKDQGIFTHAGSRTHLHCVLNAPAATGHVDHVRIPAGTIVKFPVVGE